MSSKLKWLIVIHLLLTEQALCRTPSPPVRNTKSHGIIEEKANQEYQSALGSKVQPGPESSAKQKEELVQSAKHIVSNLREKLQGQIQANHLHVQGNVSCEELLSASSLDDPSPSMFPQEVLGFSLVPVLVVAGCPHEAQTLVIKLYKLLGVGDTEELLMELEDLMEKKMSSAASKTAGPLERNKAEQNMEAVMFNIQQLATAGGDEQEGHCEGWIRVNGTTLVGTAVEGATADLDEAVRACERLGDLCAGVTSKGPLESGEYRAVLKKGSHILLSESAESECWIRQCHVEEDVSVPVASGSRMKRSPQRSCINKSEQRVFKVMEWIPAVSTLYSLGTAVYYASVNCSETAKERAILSAVDLGTDALIVATGGTVGVAGYALGAGVKTGVKAGVKFLLNSMKQEDDVLVNQFSSEDGVFTIE